MPRIVWTVSESTKRSANVLSVHQMSLDSTLSRLMPTTNRSGLSRVDWLSPVPASSIRGWAGRPRSSNLANSGSSDSVVPIDSTCRRSSSSRARTSLHGIESRRRSARGMSRMVRGAFSAAFRAVCPNLSSRARLSRVHPWVRTAARSAKVPGPKRRDIRRPSGTPRAATAIKEIPMFISDIGPSAFAAGSEGTGPRNGSLGLRTIMVCRSAYRRVQDRSWGRTLLEAHEAHVFDPVDTDAEPN